MSPPQPSPRHRLVVLGDSLSQGFMSGAIHRTDVSYPALVARTLGLDRHGFRVPDFRGAGGLPLNLERIIRSLSDNFGREVRWWEAPLAFASLRSQMDVIEDYWERGPGSKPLHEHTTYHNLAVWGYRVSDVQSVTSQLCDDVIPEPIDHWFKQVPERSHYRTARRVLNPANRSAYRNRSAMDAAREFARDGGIENLVVFLGSNNVLGTVNELRVVLSTDEDARRPPHQRATNLDRPKHFAAAYRHLADQILSLGAQRVFVGTVPHVTIPPISRGVGRRCPEGYFDYYTRPWIWDDEFRPHLHRYLDRQQARTIDATVDAYNATIRHIADRNGWHVFDTCQLLDDLSYRRHGSDDQPPLSPFLAAALERRSDLAYLVDEHHRATLDTRFMATSPESPRHLERGGLFSLDGIHPTTIGYGLIAETLLLAMRTAGVEFPGDGYLDWDHVLDQDSLVSQPPALLANLRHAMRIFDRRGLLAAVLGEFRGGYRQRAIY